MDFNKYLKNFGLTFVFIGAAIGIGLTACGFVAGIGSLI